MSNVQVICHLVVTFGGCFHEDGSLWEVSLLVDLEIGEHHFQVHLQWVGQSYCVGDDSYFWLNTICDVDHMVVSLDGGDWIVNSVVSQWNAIFKFLEWIHGVAEDGLPVG